MSSHCLRVGKECIPGMGNSELAPPGNDRLVVSTDCWIASWD